MKRFTKHQIPTLIKGWIKAKKAEAEFYATIGDIERELTEELGIDIQIFQVDNEIVGIGDYLRAYKLLQAKKLNTFRF